MNSKIKVIRNVLLVGFGGVLGQMAAILSTPVLTRLYTPQSYGEWALLLSLAIIPGTLASLRYEVAVLLPDSHGQAANVFALCCMLSCLVACGTALLLWLVPDSFVSTIGFSSLKLWFWSVPILILARGIHQACISWHTRMANFLHVSLIAAMLPICTVATQIASPLFGGSRDAGGLILGSIVGHILAAGAGLILLYSTRRLIFPAVSWRQIATMFREYGNCPLYRTPYTIVSELRNRLAVFCFGAYGQTAGLGFFVFSERMMRAPVNTVTSAIRPIFFQKAASHNLHKLQASLVQSLLFINKAATPFFVLFWFEHANMYECFFGPEWRAASIYGLILSVPLFVLLHTNWLDRAMDVLGRQKLAFWLEAGFSGLSIAMLVTGLIVFESVFYGVVLQSATFAVYNIVWLIVMFRVARFDSQGLSQLLKQAVALAASWAVAYFVLSMAFPVVAASSVYLLVVLAYAYRTLRAEWSQLRKPDREESIGRGDANIASRNTDPNTSSVRSPISSRERQKSAVLSPAGRVAQR